MVCHHLEVEVVEAVEEEEGVQIQCHSVRVRAEARWAEGQVFQAVAAAAAAEGQVQLADQLEEAEAEAVQPVQRR